MKNFNQKAIVVAFVLLLNLVLGASVSHAQEMEGSWSTTYPSYETGSWSTTYPTYETGSWSTTYPTYETGSWSTTYPTYESANYPTYESATYSYPTYETAATTGGVSYTPAVYTTVSDPVSSTVITSPNSYYGYTNYGYTGSYYPAVYGTVGYGYTNSTVNQTSCPSNYSFVNGVCQPPTQCPAGQSLVNNTCQPTTVCPTNTTLVNGTCVVNTTTTCPAGTTLVNGVCTSTTITNTNNYYVCSNGTIVNFSYQCPTYTNYPTYTYQTCWDGTVIANTSVCPSQYKVCPNGTSIPVSQTCYYNNYSTYSYSVPQTVKFNNVVTSLATQVTNVSGRCNGIGLIANGAQSTGWFEYGETVSLGRETAKASIGTSATAPFSNLLTNLKPNTRYYCRAVMQNQYGIVKGEIVGFTTKGTATTYVQPVAKKVTTTKKAAPVKKTIVTCTDGTTSWVKNETSASLLSQGEKLVALNVEKTEGDYSVSGTVTYKISYKNATDSSLTGVVLAVVFPQEVEVVSATAGTYDSTTRTLTLNQDTLRAYDEGTITVKGKITNTASIGKSIVTTAYIVYTVPTTKVQDEVTAYVVGSITPEVTKTSDTGAKKVYGNNLEDRGFLPASLVEWLALIAILFIIFILGRSIYMSYQGEKEAH